MIREKKCVACGKLISDKDTIGINKKLLGRDCSLTLLVDYFEPYF